MHPESLTTLEAEVARTRAQLHHSVQQIEEEVNIPRRIRQEIGSHPLKWTAIGTGIALATLKVLPVVFKLARRPAGAFILRPLLATAATAAVPVIQDFMNQKFFGPRRTVEATPIS